ncbi:MAG: helix-turn-helix domain-containing protein [Clostridia bacterium]|nr:helix-turn-helix domain-containing protein [Clostridia bacterium]
MIRKLSGLSNEDFASSLSITTEELQKLEKGKAVPSDALTETLKKAYPEAWEQTDVPEVDVVDVAMRVRELRTKYGMTRREFGDTILSSSGTVARVEQALWLPSDTWLERIVTVFSVPLKWLKGLDGTSPFDGELPAPKPLSRTDEEEPKQKSADGKPSNKNASGKKTEEKQPVKPIVNAKAAPSAQGEPRKSSRKIDVPKDLGAKIRQYRERHGMSQKTFADALGVRGNTISQLELGTGSPSAELLSRILQTYPIYDEEESVKADAPAEESATSTRPDESTPDAASDASSPLEDAASEIDGAPDETVEPEDDVPSASVPSCVSSEESAPSEEAPASTETTSEGGVLVGLLQAVRILARHLDRESFDSAMEEIQNCI